MGSSFGLQRREGKDLLSLFIPICVLIIIFILKIVALSDSVNRVKNDQVRLESELDFVRAQQRELEEMLIPLEESLQLEVNNMPHDAEREHTYRLLSIYNLALYFNSFIFSFSFF